MAHESSPFLPQSPRGRPRTVRSWWHSRSRDVVSLLTLLLLVGTGLGIWVYGTLPTSDPDGHPHEYALSTTRIRNHLSKFLEIAEAHNNSRSVTNGHAASAQYVIDQLQQHGSCDVHVQHFMSPVWTVNKAPVLRASGPVDVDFIFETDFQVMRYGGQGADIKNAKVAVVDDGCTASTIGDVEGRIVLVHPHGKCTIFESAFLLEQLGASAVVFIRSSRYPTPSRARVRISDWKEGDPLMTVPVLSVTHSVGQVLEGLKGVRLDVFTDTRIDVVKTFNVICVGRHGDPDSTVLVGSHLDSVAAGPGINDNGSGSASTLEIQLTLTGLNYRPHNRLVFAWWGAEEDGLLGSRHFARVLAQGWKNRWTDSETVGGVTWSQIALDLNFDMLGSPNYIALVHNGTDAPSNARMGSQRIQRVFEDYFVRHQYPFQVTDMLAGSDFLPFVDNGIPAGGVLTGAGELKTIQERREHGGMANAPLDTCYHRDCDGILNINVRGLDQMSKAAMYAVSTLSSTPHLREFLGTPLNN